jgi:hypothetical protein
MKMFVTAVVGISVLSVTMVGCERGGGARGVAVGSTSKVAVYGTHVKRRLGFVMFTDIPQHGTSVSAGSAWTGRVKPANGLTINYRGSAGGLEIDGTAYKFTEGRVFLVSTKEGKISVAQLDVPMSDAVYDAEIDRIAELSEVQEFLVE